MFGTDDTNRLTAVAKSLRQPAPWPIPRELDKRPLPPYIVEPGDVLVIHSADLDSPIRLPGDQPVLPDGTINLGRYGHQQVAGKTVPEIEALVRAAVEAVTPDAGFIVVRVVARPSKVFYVLGEVNAPGSFPLTGRETVLDGILAAGGLTDQASRKNIILSRPSAPDSCRVVLPVCYNEIVQLGDTTTNYQLAPGDRIFIPAAHCWESRKKHATPCCGPQSPCPPPSLEQDCVAPATPATAPLPLRDLLPAPRRTP
jgi:protein involved in polysaccharide export with SLBB domain